MNIITCEQLPALFQGVAAVFAEKKEELCEMDANMGDGDLGLTMDKGYGALPGLLQENMETGDAGKTLMKAGMKMSSVVPSTMGTLMSSGIMEGGKALKGWKAATDELIALQARWKETGAVSRRHSDRIWKRFRAACDRFFARKSEHFAAVDGEYEENLRRKLALLDEMEAADAAAGGFELIRDFQRRWSEIGFVPIRRKEAVQKRYIKK